MPRILPFLLLLAAAAAAAGCSHEDGPPGAGTPALVTPHEFPATSSGVPSGYREVLCPDLRRGGTGLAVRLVVPERATSSRREADGCTFSVPTEPRDAISVRVGPGESLARWREVYLDPYVSPDGDDAVGEIAYRSDARGFGDSTGEELSWYSFSDGYPVRVVSLLAAGVRLSWSVPADDRLPAPALDVVRRSVGVLDRAAVSPGRPSRS